MYEKIILHVAHARRCLTYTYKLLKFCQTSTRSISFSNMPSECSKQKLVKYHQWPLRFTTQFFYKQAVFVGKNCWVVVCISVAVSMSLSIAWLIPKEQSPQDAIKETARMYAVRNGKYNQNYRSTKHLFDVDANFTTEIWPHQMVSCFCIILL